MLTLILAGGQRSRLSTLGEKWAKRRPGWTDDDYDQLEVPSGGTISKRATVIDDTVR